MVKGRPRIKFWANVQRCWNHIGIERLFVWKMRIYTISGEYEAERCFEPSKNFRLQISNPKKVPGNVFFGTIGGRVKKTLVFLSSNEHGRQRLAAKPATLRQEASTELQEASMENQGFDWKTKKLLNTKKLSWNTKKLSWNTKKLSWNTKKRRWNTKEL